MDESLCAPRTVVPIGRIDRPAAAAAEFRERTDPPGLAHLTAAPGTIRHKTHELAFAVATVSVITQGSNSGLFLRLISRTITPRTKPPRRMHPLMAAMADMAELAARIKAITTAAAPRANRHLFGNRLAAIQTGKVEVQDLAVPRQKRLAPGFPPVGFLGFCRFFGEAIETLFGRRL